ncbi:MAG TPA: molybdopterin cofactor-binding domain-containing protein [Steroidobacteraceae bacterium]|nr:molybdopterin cofactor-binding domain-containing protein [Steroidobacteraceae bacterium]
MSAPAGVSRREFFQMVGGGIVVCVGGAALPGFGQSRWPRYPDDVDAYLLIGADGRVTVFSGKIEMGQGVMTSLAQMAAEELGVELEAIDMVLGDTGRCPWDMGTFGSMTTRMFGPALRAAAAEARVVLTGLAAARLGVPADRLTVRNGVVSVRDTPSRQVSYAELAAGRQLMRRVDAAAVLKAAADFQVMGRPATRLDARVKVTGEAKYAADLRLPGQVYARVLRPPVHRAQLRSLDASAAEAIDGVTVVRRDDLVAVLHADPVRAGEALAALRAQWQLPREPGPDHDSIFGQLAGSGVPLTESTHRGDVTAARKAAASIFESTYRKGYVAHAPIEPHAALAEVSGGKARVWASTQTPFPTRDHIAHTLGLAPEAVRVITPFLGGGFGGKSADRQAVEAARLAQLCGRPVQVAWDRSEEFFYDRFDPAAVVEIASGVDAARRVAFWDFTVYAAGERGAAHVYDIPDLRVRSGGGMSYEQSASPEQLHPFEVGPWRAPGANMNVFAIESQMDIMAAACGEDPLGFRLRHLSDARMRGVLQAAAAAFGWKAAAAPSGRGVGIACSTDAGSYVAACAEVAVDETKGTVRVVRVVCAEDLGIVVNPEGARMQIEGGVTMGLGYALSEELQFRGGDILDRNFDTYHLPRFSSVPRIEAVLVRNDALTPQGGGEPPITIMGAVIANAVFDATGSRQLRLPMTPERVLAGLAAAKHHGS